MDSSIVPMGESHRKSDSAASASKLGSLVQINSIAIDISTSAMEEMEPPTHEHFSIRGFVAGMRKKNSKTCLPFASEDNDANLMDYLPPLFVPRFRWWQCSNCVPDIAMKSAEEIVKTSRSDVGTSSCQNVGEKIGLFLQSMENIGIKEKTNATDKEAGSPCDMPEANPLQIRERFDNTWDASDMVHVAEHYPKLPGNDGTFSALPHRGKPKLRSLADILVEEKNPIGDDPKTMQITSTEMMEADLGPQIELDIPATKSPERKRKIALEEDRGPLGVIFPSAAKKTESEGDASMRLAQRTKPKKNKALDNRKKMKQTHAGNGTVSRREFPKISVKCTANLQKHGVSQEASFGKLGDLSGQQIQRISNVSSKTHGFEADDDTHLMSNSNGILDLSLNSYRGAERNSKSEASFVKHRRIPDLNVVFHHKTAKTHGKKVCAVSEKKKLPLHETLDVSTSSSKEKAKGGKNKMGVTKPPKKDRNLELGSSDDIPMEIVELLAKNQHERALGNPSRCINNSPREYRALHVDQHPDTINFPPANRKSGLTVANRNMGFGQNNIFVNLPPLKKS